MGDNTDINMVVNIMIPNPLMYNVLQLNFQQILQWKLFQIDYYY